MTKEDKDGIKEILHDYIKGIVAQQDAKFDIIDFKLDAIKEQTTKTNGRVTKLEEKEVLHIKECPMRPKVEALEKESNVRFGIKHFVITGIAIIATVIGAVYSTIKIVESHQKPNTENIQPK